MSPYDAIKEIQNRLKTLSHNGQVPVYAAKEDLKQALESAINDANMIEKLARGIQGDFNEIYKRMVDPAGWDPDAPYQPAVEERAEGNVELCHEPDCAVCKDARVARAAAVNRRTPDCDGCGDCRGGDGPCSKT